MKEQQNNLNDEEMEEIQASIVTGDGSEIRVTEKVFARFIGNNADKYIPKFRKFNRDGGDKAALTWHWPAFFFWIPMDGLQKNVCVGSSGSTFLQWRVF
jgi:hypothetical protein